MLGIHFKSLPISLLLGGLILGGGLMISEAAEISLPKPSEDGRVSVERAIKSRRTIRQFQIKPLTLSQLSQLLWAGQGVTESGGFEGRAAPSGGALYPLDLYAVVGKDQVAGLKPAVYQYLPERHTLLEVSPGDQRRALAKAALGQMWMADAPVILAITAEYRRITGKYGERGIRYALIEAGHAGQNLFLQAEALGLGAGIVGAFADEEVRSLLRCGPGRDPLLLLPVGYRR